MADAPKYATGGIIPNYDGTHDDVPIFHEPGYIITAAMARRWGRRYGLAALDRLNRSEDPPDA